MVVNKRKKVTKFRAHTTHGGGSRKKRRGAGSRGGRGNAGTGKRAGHKVAGISRKLGSTGFVSKRRKKVSIMNVGDFTYNYVEKLVSSEKATKQGDLYVIDLKVLGVTKLLGTGEADVKLQINVAEASAKATQKVKAAGGDVNKPAEA